MNNSKAAGLSLANLWVGFIAFAAATVLGVYQVVLHNGQERRTGKLVIVR